MGSVNKHVLVGSLGADPKPLLLGDKTCAILRVGTDHPVSGGGTTVEWHRVIVWGKDADTANKVLKKGDGIYIEGRVQTRTWRNPDGSTGEAHETVCERMIFLPGRKGITNGQSE